MKIAIAAGGTYGHIYPALSLIDSLKKNGTGDILLVTHNRELKSSLLDCGIKTYFISNTKISRVSIFAFFLGTVRLIKAICQCIRILLKIRPDVVIGFGGYASFPLVFSACILRIPSAIHEQNVVMGRANSFLSFPVKKVMLSFSQTNVFLNRKKTVVVGNPIRTELRVINKDKALGYLGLRENLFTVLVMGGSLGSRVINRTFVDAVRRMKNKKFQLIHLTGKNDFEFVAQFYKELGSLEIKSKVFSFYKQMSYPFSAADLIISRAGALSICEIAFFNISSILIPYLYAGAHQIENAKVLADNRAALLIEENNLTDQVLAGYLDDFINHPEKLVQIKQALSSCDKFNHQAADRLACELIKLKR